MQRQADVMGQRAPPATLMAPAVGALTPATSLGWRKN
jgi:hypothetical protein